MGEISGKNDQSIRVCLVLIQTDDLDSVTPAQCKSIIFRFEKKETKDFP